MGCGTLRERKDGVVYYEVTNIASLYNVVIPFFKKYKFRSANKKNNFRIFSEIVSMMFKSEHHTKEGLQRVLGLREQLNSGAGRKRKYQLEDIITSEESSETIRKTDSNHKLESTI